MRIRPTRTLQSASACVTLLAYVGASVARQPDDKASQIFFVVMALACVATVVVEKRMGRDAVIPHGQGLGWVGIDAVCSVLSFMAITYPLEQATTLEIVASVALLLVGLWMLVLAILMWINSRSAD